MRRRLPLVLTLLAATLTQYPPAWAADEPPQFGESIDVRVVNLEAVVTDRAGKRVTGLKPSDFRLRVDGKDVPIEYFNEVNDGQALAAPAASAKAEAAAPAVQGVTEGAVGTYYLVFIDDYFAIASKRDVVLKSIKGDLSRLGPNDRMAIVAYDGGRLAMLSSWSESQADLAKAFDAAMQRKPRGFDRITEQRELLHDDAFASQTVGDGAPLDTNVLQTGLNDRQRVYGESLARQLKGDVQAAVSSMRAFAAPRGRKVMLLLSGGWPFSVNAYISGGNGLPVKQIPDGEEIFRPLANTANLLGYTLYPIDLPGTAAPDADVDATAPSTLGARSFPKNELDSSLGFLAKETGGEAMYNGNNRLALAAAKEDTRSFYWLGFSPSWQRNDKGHQIRLEARQSGLKLRSRTGFLDLSRKAEVSMEVESALLFGNPPGGLQMPMKVGALTSSRGETQIPITLGLPVSLMTVVPVGGKFAAQLELRIAASDSEGNTSEIPVVPVSLSSAQAPVAGHFVHYDTKIKLRGKANHLVVAAYDPLSGKVATAETDLKMP